MNEHHDKIVMVSCTTSTTWPCMNRHYKQQILRFLLCSLDRYNTANVAEHVSTEISMPSSAILCRVPVEFACYASLHPNKPPVHLNQAAQA
jgi:hypothetical protein